MFRWLFSLFRPSHLYHEELANIRKMRADGRLDQAERTLKKAVPSPAVLDELRKIASLRAWEAKKKQDWSSVITHLENYNKYAQKCEAKCLETVNQKPPAHSSRDRKLLAEAKKQVRAG